MKGKKKKYGVGRKGCLICVVIAGISGLWHGKAEAGEGKGVRFCMIVPDRSEPQAAQVRHYPGAEPMFADRQGSRTVTFFKGQLNKVGVGLPDCFRIEAEEAAAVAAVTGGSDAVAATGYLPATSTVFPRAGYFNRISDDGRRGIAFGAGIGHTATADGEEKGSPDGRVGIVIGFNF